MARIVSPAGTHPEVIKMASGIEVLRGPSREPLLAGAISMRMRIVIRRQVAARLVQPQALGGGRPSARPAQTAVHVEGSLGR